MEGDDPPARRRANEKLRRRVGDAMLPDVGLVRPVSWAVDSRRA